jgi:hypothetical protein
LRTLSGAYLIGRHAELIEVHRKCTFDTDPVPGLLDITEQYCQVLLAEKLTRQVDEKSLKEAGPDLLALPPIFRAISRRDRQAFAEALEEYLAKRWEKYAKGLRRAIKNPAPIYFGTWNLFSAAVCKIVGVVPPLSKKAQSYVPVDLLKE